MSTDRMLQTVGGVLLAVVGGLCGYCFTQIQGHESRLTKVETKQDNSEKTVNEIKASIDKIGEKLDRLWQAIEQRRPGQ